ncbi:MAG: 2,3,4,5-tetrahydropyridine-2,6-carboxylate N-succinyltransferase [SAR86 cluster bacterium]|jgi:2,3,4,5-tetrahydropyridine-2-carboxylate N-succinyltransferase|uniref:2,3,4,5-tetrahydropyridine-2,6-dicarboxylate N-succinyltransferase n=1 Tax=SAR86 cluster bacterium TaxID=2030880 RepID=A0A937M2B8_9GAMM|nr:2,3,4,5-tetrahydropyridine-2,6-carboxylate N-succinyltransferase [SAR86 cluster bacterium]|tara:strand:+ start:197 stop:1099 length:903 start_codon:yes stop_codon:yes gene_type:complete
MKINALGLTTVSSYGDTLDVFFPFIKFGEDQHVGEKNFITASQNKNLIEVNCDLKDLEKPIKDLADAYLRLHLLSYKFVLPNSISLEGLFEILPNVVWTNYGAVSPKEIDKKLLNSKLQNKSLTIKSIDKFPRLTDFIVPKGVRIADASRVRLGAYLSEGTTIMHEGFVNFNAGTLGKAMIEGRISAGVLVGSNSDLGGGSSTMGTLSGGNTTKISIGENCLLGANSGLGIPLGNNCIIEAGLYLTAGTKVTLSDNSIVKALELANKDNLLFIRNSTSGIVEAKINKSLLELNPKLHKNN